MALSTARARLFAFFGLLFVAVSYLFFAQNSISYPTSFAKSRRPNGVIFMLLAPNRLVQATKALMNVEDRFNRRLKYPYVLFTAENEVAALTDEIKAKVHYITEGRVTFATTTPESWGVPNNLDQARVNASLQNIGFTLGYRSMCRYYSGFFWRHPALAPYDWLWRLDTDIEFHCDVPYDPIQRLIESKALYGFIQVNDDADWVQPSLASNVSHFMFENRDLIPHDANHGFVWNDAASVERALTGTAGNEDWTRKCMYNNFEISHKSIWEGKLYSKFFEYLDKAGGFFYERWGDSPIHSFGLAMSLRKDQAVQFHDLGYQHQGWSYECAQELDRCACEREGLSANFDHQGNSWFNPRA
jgi:mannosyltransferase